MITTQHINLGDTVKQKCGGPCMTVVAMDLAYPCADGSVGGLFCLWEEDNLLYEHVFSPFALDLIRQAGGIRDSAERRRQAR